MPHEIPFIDLAHDFSVVGDDVRARFERVLESQRFVDGVQTAELEHSLASLTGVEAVACSSGSDALYLSLLAAGVGPGDAVVVPAFTFFSTAGAVARTGALPVFADVAPATLMLGARELGATLSSRFEPQGRGFVEIATRARLAAVIVVHLFGRAAALDELATVLADAPVVMIEDAAQAIGARSGSGPVGCGQLVSFSFHPTKNVGGAGDGGAVTTRDAGLAERIRRLRNHGSDGTRYVHAECGINARMGELAAAMVNAKLARLAEWTAARARLAASYAERLAGLERRGLLRLPAPASPPLCVWHQYTVRFAHGRDAVAAAMAAAGVETRVFYPLPLHRQPCFVGSGHRPWPLPEAERAAADVLSLPIYPALTEAGQERVCEALERAVREVA